MTTHDTAQATDAKVEELKILLPPEIGRYDNDAYQATLLRAYVPGILARLDASEKRVEELERDNLELQREADSAFGRGYERGKEDGQTIGKLRPL